MQAPLAAQQETLLRLLDGYRRTAYGRAWGASEVTNRVAFAQRCPVVRYADLEPWLARVRAGDWQALLPEPVDAWVMTRGTTGRPKVLPVTSQHVAEILLCGARALVNYHRQHLEAGLFDGAVLNLNFPSRVSELSGASPGTWYGYSSGTYARLHPKLGGARLIPSQEAVDALGPDITSRGWEARFALAYREAKDADVRTLIGVTPVLLAFAAYVRRRHCRNPRHLWHLRAIFATSVAKIPFKYAPILRNLYGPVSVVELYSATEGVFAQQRDTLPYVCPNYDVYYFEVRQGTRTRPLTELRRGEWGRLVISSCLFPRYDIGDYVECLGGNYFRVFGRATWRTWAEHRLWRALTRWFV